MTEVEVAMYPIILVSISSYPKGTFSLEEQGMKFATLVLTAVFAIAIFVFAYGYTYSISSPYYVTASEGKAGIAQKRYNVVLDVRTALERAVVGYYPGSIHIPVSELRERISKEIPDKNTSILIYCNTGQRARAAAELLQSLGYKNTRYIATTHIFLY
jgi:rhodanese-related sulfurtransferase